MLRVVDQGSIHLFTLLFPAACPHNSMLIATTQQFSGEESLLSVQRGKIPMMKSFVGDKNCLASSSQATVSASNLGQPLASFLTDFTGWCKTQTYIVGH